MAVRTYPHGEVCRYQAGVTDPLVEALPHYHLVEKDPKKHRAWRVDLYRRAATNKALQQKLREACADDPLFFINAFCWIVEPRGGRKKNKLLPFNTWVHQDPIIANIAEYWGVRHMIGDKSRAQGASWIMVALIVWGFLYGNGDTYGIGSKDEETADDPNDPGSLGWKIDFLIENLPPWMKPTGYAGSKADWKYRLTGKSTWENPDNGCSIKAYAATKGLARGGRFTVFFLDESAFFPRGDREAFANLMHTTDCLVAISTPHGMDNAHYDFVHKSSPWLKLILDWKDNPEQSRGLYTMRHGRIVFLDKNFDWAAEYPEGYEHSFDGRIRSPWYDQECANQNNDMLFIAQELDREYSGSKGRPFPQAAVDRMGVHVRKPLHTGMLTFDDDFPMDMDEIQWVEAEGYKFDLYTPLVRGVLPKARYVIGADLSRGVGGELSSNSSLEIFNLDTAEQIGELAINTIDPVGFARLTVAICYWLGQGEPTPFLNWEREGPGHEFGKEILRLGYTNVWYPIIGDDMKRYGKRSPNPGYSNKDRDKALEPLIAAIINGTCTIRSGALLEECGHYIFGDDGKPMHPHVKTARDGSSKGVSHGDRVIAAAMAMHAMFDRRRAGKSRKSRKENVIPDFTPPDSIAGRMAARQRKADRAKYLNCRF